MRVVDDVRVNEMKLPGVVLTAGSFDGVHVGHQAILQRVVRLAREREGTAAVLTMHPHPREVFSPAHPPNLLTHDVKKAQLLAELGIDVVFVLPFCEEVARLDAETFFKSILRDACHAEALVVGHDFRFGRNAQGDFDYLKEAGAEQGMSVLMVPPVLVAGERVSSTLVRECVLEGDLARAEELLGRKYSLMGKVVDGRGIGVSLGFPTANVKPHHSAVPAHGVYAAKVLCSGECYPAAVNIGIAPTIRHEDITIEAFLLDFSGDIRGCDIEIFFCERLRPERKFRDRDELIGQIKKDVHAVRACLCAEGNDG